MRPHSDRNAMAMPSDQTKGDQRTTTNPASPVGKQTTEYRNVCAAIQEKVGNKKVWRKVYRRHLERAVVELGEKALLALVAELDFSDVSYLFSTRNGMCLLDRKVEEHRKAAEVAAERGGVFRLGDLLTGGES